MADIIADFERDLLRFPAHADGLLRRGSPVWMQWLPAAVEPVALCAPHRDSNGEMRVCVSDGGASPLLSLVSLGLTDATGRAHLAWWMARELRAVIYEPSKSGDRGQPAWVYAAGPRAWSIERVGHSFMRTQWAAGCDEPVTALNPDDPRLLPDGSRLVDALALSLVGRHLLAGGGR